MLIDAPTPLATDMMDSADPGGSSSSSMGVFPVIAVQPQPTKAKAPGLQLHDWTILGFAATLRVLDFTSTEKALTEPQYVHEAMLPQALVKNKAAFAAFEASTVAVNYEAYRYLVRHNRRRLARISQYAYVGIMTGQVARNYQLLSNVPAH